MHSQLLKAMRDECQQPSKSSGGPADEVEAMAIMAASSGPEAPRTRDSAAFGEKKPQNMEELADSEPY